MILRPMLLVSVFVIQLMVKEPAKREKMVSLGRSKVAAGAATANELPFGSRPLAGKKRRPTCPEPFDGLVTGNDCAWFLKSIYVFSR